MSKTQIEKSEKVKGKGTKFDEKNLKCIKEFDDLNLDTKILHGIFSYGFLQPSIVQQKGIYPIIQEQKKDIIIQAQSGTGKTGTFTISMLENLHEEVNELQGLILTPTRELAFQIMRVIIGISRYTDFRIHCCIGGKSVMDDVTAFKRSEKIPQICVGTCGRILHMIEEDVLPVKGLKMLILDEADKMLSGVDGFRDALYEIFSYLPKNLQICLFSATMPMEIVELSEKFMDNPIKILMKSSQLTLQGIKQYYVNVKDESGKYPTLIDIYKSLCISKAIIFCHSMRSVDNLAESLKSQNFSVSKLHGGLKGERINIISKFRKNTTRILVTTDVLARGIDIHQVSLVVNYDMPRDKESYLHRIGRAGRFGRRGSAINLITRYDYRKKLEIEKFYHTVIEPLPKDYAELIA